ncbi:MAG TPA: hypothetical protein VMP41_07635 [Acidimicrobiales bacterium]|nr:hypothetical protein [Acidimicrobiales bacterium]
MVEERHSAATAEEPMTAAERRQRRARVVQIALGCLWILDAALQFQPRMFGSGLVDNMMLPMAQGQPAPVTWSITNLAHLIRPDAGVWNFFFGALQLAIGVGMLFRRTVKPAIVAMAIWALGVWWFGEGFGMLFTGAASPLTGAPGAVLLYPLIGLLVWPTEHDANADVASGIASSAAATGPLGASAPLFAWSGFWVLSAVLWLFPDNRASGAIGAQITTAASGEPSWYAHFQTSVANALPHSGSALAWLLAGASLVIAAGPVLTRRPRPFLVAGVVLQALFWITGMALGAMLTGMGTDPNAAPLVALLAVAMVPTLRAVPVSSPGRVFMGRHPVAGATTSVVALAVLAISSTYPVAAASASASGGASQSSSSSMAGMAMGPRTSHTSHTAKGKMDMPGMNGQTDPSWHYTGPALPTAEVSVLTTVYNETEKGHAMQTPNCTTAPTGAQTEAAMGLVQTTSAAVSKYKDLSAATAAGYVPITDTRYPVVHYLNYSYMRSGNVLDPDHVQSLVYAFTPYGPVLVAAMYLMPSQGDPGPMPGGCLTQWHAHTNLCSGGTGGLISGFQTNGVCPSGENPLMTPEMMHVWQVPVPGGPLTMDPTDQQIVEAAIMAQQDGQAPVSPGTPPPSLSGSFGT